MTTPEKLRRRQRIETALVGLLMVVVGVTQYINDREDNRQDAEAAAARACLAKQITSLTDALNARSAPAGSLNEATGDVLDSFVAAAEAQKKGKDNSTEILAALNHYAEVRAEVRKSRAENPFPAFPTGKCDE